jgi:hypothetical protein
VQHQYGAPVPEAGMLGAVPQAGSELVSRRAPRVARGAFRAAPGQCRGCAAGARAGQGRRRLSAHGRSARQRLRAEAKATVRFETRPRRQLQADFGQCTVAIGGERVRAYMCILTFGYSRRCFVRAWPCERHAQWLATFESAVAHFGVVPEELLIDNPRALVLEHDPRTRGVVFHPTFVEFCKHWGPLSVSDAAWVTDSRAAPGVAHQMSVTHVPGSHPSTSISTPTPSSDPELRPRAPTPSSDPELRPRPRPRRRP